MPSARCLTGLSSEQLSVYKSCLHAILKKPNKQWERTRGNFTYIMILCWNDQNINSFTTNAVSEQEPQFTCLMEMHAGHYMKI